jgi:hypothetical protein
VCEVDGRDTVVEMRDAPRPAVGAPLTHLVCDEHHLFLAYIVFEPDPDWDGSYATMVGPDSEGYL